MVASEIGWPTEVHRTSRRILLDKLLGQFQLGIASYRFMAYAHPRRTRVPDTDNRFFEFRDQGRVRIAVFKRPKPLLNELQVGGVSKLLQKALYRACAAELRAAYCDHDVIFASLAPGGKYRTSRHASVVCCPAMEQSAWHSRSRLRIGRLSCCCSSVRQNDFSAYVQSPPAVGGRSRWTRQPPWAG